jgi:hypothetical protein
MVQLVPHGTPEQHGAGVPGHPAASLAGSKACWVVQACMVPQLLSEWQIVPHVAARLGPGLLMLLHRRAMRHAVPRGTVPHAAQAG